MFVKRLRIAICFTICLATIIASADSYAPFTNYRAVDATGEYYVVLKRRSQTAPGFPLSVDFEIAKRNNGSPPVLAFNERSAKSKLPGDGAQVRPGDTIIGKGTLDRAPRHIVISSTGLGFVGVDVYGHNFGELRNGAALVIVSIDGTIRHRKNLIDLFSAVEVGTFMRSTGSVWWSGYSWIDEKSKQVVIVSERSEPGRKRLFRTVDIESGEVRSGTSELVTIALRDRIPSAIEPAIELAAELKLSAAAPDLAMILDSDSLSLMTRLRAASALARRGNYQGREMVRKAVLDHNVDNATRITAIRYVPYMLGDDAAKVLCELLRQGDDSIRSEAALAMRDVSAATANPLLVEIVRKGPVDALDSAIECLDWKGADAVRPVIPDLIKLLENAPKTNRPLWTQQLAALALGKCRRDAREALPALIRLAEKHSGDEWNRLKDNSPRMLNPFNSRDRYSTDWFVDAILRIRQ